MWSAAVLEPALPVRSSPARASPPAISGRSRNASSGCSRTSSSRSARRRPCCRSGRSPGWRRYRCAASHPAGGRACGPGRRPRPGPGRPHPGQVRGIDALIDQPPHRGRRRLRPEDVLTVTAQLPDPVDAVRAVSDRGRQIGEHITGRIHPRAPIGIRQRGVTCADNPVRSASSRSMPIPACDTTPWPSADTFTRDAPRYSSPAKCLPVRND